jgi:hypothetical protein
MTIPDSIISTKVLLDAYIHLRNELNGRCDDDFCPNIEIRFDQGGWGLDLKLSPYKKKRIRRFCSFCGDAWGTDFCPCKNDLNPKYIFLRLDSVIEQLKEKLKKEIQND